MTTLTKRTNSPTPAQPGAPSAGHAGPADPDVRRLAHLLAAHAPYDGVFPLRTPGASAVRRSQPYAEPLRAIYQPALCIVAQGAKTVELGQEAYEYNAARVLVVTVDLPVTVQVTRASFAEPFLCLRLDLDAQKIAELTLRVYPHGAPPLREQRAVYLGHASAGIVNAATRLVELMAQPDEADLLAPLVVDEILIRLLRSPIGGRVAQIGYGESGVHRVAQAVAWLRDNYAQPMNVEALAASLHMSVSSFHQHFKAVTSMSPLQYQKALRLQEARRLLVSKTMDVGAASRRVGYLSPSQFSREYNRYFGASPSQDIAHLRQDGPAEPAPAD